MPHVPYEDAKSGSQAREQITKLLRKFGVTQVGFLDEFDTHSVRLQFTYRNQPVLLRASAQGWANMYLKANPWHRGRRYDQRAWEHRALNMGMVAVNSVLRDWVKGEITAIESGMLEFEHVFLAHMMLPSGETVGEIAFHPTRGLLSAPKDD